MKVKVTRKTIARILKESRKKIVIFFLVVTILLGFLIGLILGYHKYRFSTDDTSYFINLSKEISEATKHIEFPSEVKRIELLHNGKIKIVIADSAATHYATYDPISMHNNFLHNYWVAMFLVAIIFSAIFVLIFLIIIRFIQCIYNLKNLYGKIYEDEWNSLKADAIPPVEISEDEDENEDEPNDNHFDDEKQEEKQEKEEE